MRILVAACGSRGDLQPMLALSVAFQKSGHDVVLAGSPTFASEAQAFGVTFVPMGRDVQEWLQGAHVSHRNPMAMVRLLNKAMEGELEAQFSVLPALARQADVVLGGGALIAAESVAAACKIPFRYVAYTPQVLPSSGHAP